VLGALQVVPVLEYSRIRSSYDDDQNEVGFYPDRNRRRWRWWIRAAGNRKPRAGVEHAESPGPSVFPSRARSAAWAHLYRSCDTSRHGRQLHASRLLRWQDGTPLAWASSVANRREHFRERQTRAAIQVVMHVTMAVLDRSSAAFVVSCCHRVRADCMKPISIAVSTGLPRNANAPPAIAALRVFSSL